MACFRKRYISEPTVFVETEPPVTESDIGWWDGKRPTLVETAENAVDAESQAVAREELWDSLAARMSYRSAGRSSSADIHHTPRPALHCRVAVSRDDRDSGHEPPFAG
jgi:hypothetical protein